jgi:glycosyltransferase involved in cell wall biosynthesis
MLNINMQPILSICIPTFNRAKCLDNLLENLKPIVLEHRTEIEICISNNQSTDTTFDVIKKWQSIYYINIITQDKNIGGTRNFIAVTGLANGRWILLIGDDDEFDVDNFRKLITLLKSAGEQEWILVGVMDNTGKEILLGDIEPGRYTAKQFRKMVIRTGLYRYGFIGMHVFPACNQPIFANLANAQDTIALRQHWPHIYLLLSHIQSKPIQVFTLPVVIQEPKGTGEFWAAGDWVRVCILKLNMISRVKDSFFSRNIFFSTLLFRELYSIRNIKEIILWKVLEPEDYSCNFYQEIFPKYALFGILRFMTLPHALFVLLIFLLPFSLIKKVMNLFNYQYIYKQYELNKLKKLAQIQRATDGERLNS